MSIKKSSTDTVFGVCAQRRKKNWSCMVTAKLLNSLSKLYHIATWSYNMIQIKFYLQVLDHRFPIYLVQVKLHCFQVDILFLFFFFWQMYLLLMLNMLHKQNIMSNSWIMCAPHKNLMYLLRHWCLACAHAGSYIISIYTLIYSTALQAFHSNS